MEAGGEFMKTSVEAMEACVNIGINFYGRTSSVGHLMSVDIRYWANFSKACHLLWSKYRGVCDSLVSFVTSRAAERCVT